MDVSKLPPGMARTGHGTVAPAHGAKCGFRPLGRHVGLRWRRKRPLARRDAAVAANHCRRGAVMKPRSIGPVGTDYAAIGIGANLLRPGFGSLRDRPRQVAVHLSRAGLRPRRCAKLYRTRPWPVGLGPLFVNTVVLARTRLAPAAILERLLAIERVFGRRRTRRNAPRVLDLDLLAVGDIVAEDGLDPVLPHPRIRRRAFALRPFQDVMPTWRHPSDGSPLRVLLARAQRPADTQPWVRQIQRARPRQRLKTR